jgi:hypothetical protein
MPLIKVAGGSIDVEQVGAGRDLVLLHSLLADRSAFDRAAPLLARTRKLTLVNRGTTSADVSLAYTAAAALAATGSGTGPSLPRATPTCANGFGGLTGSAARHGAGSTACGGGFAGGFPPRKQPLRATDNCARHGGARYRDPRVSSFLARTRHRRRAQARAGETDPACFRAACQAPSSDLSQCWAIRNRRW